MSSRLEFRVGDLVGLDEPCGHLSPAEIEDLMEGRLAPDRVRALDLHAGGCASCSELIDDYDRFSALLVSGLTVPSEIKAFEESDLGVRLRVGLLRAPRRWYRALFYWLTPSLAAFTILLAVWLWPASPQLIAEVDRVPLEPPPAVRGLTLSEAWERLEAPWNADDMDEAARILASAVDEHPEQADLLFYLGVARLRSGDAAGALEALERADRMEVTTPSEHTRWMLAAALERTGRVGEACDALRSVAGIGGTRAEAAGRIVERSCP